MIHKSGLLFSEKAPTPLKLVTETSGYNQEGTHLSIKGLTGDVSNEL